MVKLNKIYTRTGDDGTTGLVGTDRVRKDDPRVEAYGTVDESNAFVGAAVLECERTTGPLASTMLEVASFLKSVQQDLFDVGADLATPIRANATTGPQLRILPVQTDRLEQTIDRYNANLAPLTSFVLPGGSAAAVALHQARTVVRRAERLAVTLLARDPAATSPEIVRYLNRLSDLLFVLARLANNSGHHDVLWIPGANRPPA